MGYCVLSMEEFGMTGKRFDFPNNVIVLLLKDDNGNLFELEDTGNYKVWNQFEQGKVFKKGKKIK